MVSYLKSVTDTNSEYYSVVVAGDKHIDLHN